MFKAKQKLLITSVGHGVIDDNGMDWATARYMVPNDYVKEENNTGLRRGKSSLVKDDGSCNKDLARQIQTETELPALYEAEISIQHSEKGARIQIHSAKLVKSFSEQLKAA